MSLPRGRGGGIDVVNAEKMLKAMHDTMEHLIELPLSLKEEGIEQALSELDAKLSAWTSAMRGAQDKLRSMIAESSSHPAAEKKSPPRVIAKPAHAESEVVDGDQAVPVEAEPIERIAEAEAPVEPAAEPRKRHGIRPVAPVVEEVEESSEPSKREEEEAFLAALEPETAQKIRVIRRLNPQGKSVQELLEEVRNNPVGQDASQPQKKSWFGRKR